ncbi:MAG TPA: hypothetical protein VHP33_33690 [Polyangiaceae bacterium]|nr:hypothetical protein [Polyangiaceae bacterium]
MSEEHAGDAIARQSDSAGAGEKPAPYHKAPSMLWILVPLLAMMAYGYFSR